MHRILFIAFSAIDAKKMVGEEKWTEEEWKSEAGGFGLLEIPCMLLVHKNTRNPMSPSRIIESHARLELYLLQVENWMSLDLWLLSRWLF